MDQSTEFLFELTSTFPIDRGDEDGASSLHHGCKSDVFPLVDVGNGCSSFAVEESNTIRVYRSSMMQVMVVEEDVLHLATCISTIRGGWPYVCHPITILLSNH